MKCQNRVEGSLDMCVLRSPHPNRPCSTVLELGPYAATTYGDEDCGPWSVDKLGAAVLAITHPNQDTASGAHGFQIIEAQRVANDLRRAFAEGALTPADLRIPEGDDR